jgi:hypothetical protein
MARLDRAIHAFRAAQGKKALLFLKKKKQKNFRLRRALTSWCRIPQGPKVFCFFFSKKKRFLVSIFSRNENPKQLGAKGVDGPVKPGHDVL